MRLIVITLLTPSLRSGIRLSAKNRRHEYIANGDGHVANFLPRYIGPHVFTQTPHGASRARVGYWIRTDAHRR